jgi:hypothetical protein
MTQHGEFFTEILHLSQLGSLQKRFEESAKYLIFSGLNTAFLFFAVNTAILIFRFRISEFAYRGQEKCYCDKLFQLPR